MEAVQRAISCEIPKVRGGILPVFFVEHQAALTPRFTVGTAPQRGSPTDK